MADKSPAPESDLAFRFKLAWNPLFGILFCFLAGVNLFVLIEANQLAFAQTRQPFDFYVLQRGASMIFSDPSHIYVWLNPGMVPGYWSPWLFDGFNYAYSPMFATLLSPLSSVYPPTAKAIWEIFSYSLLVAGCALIVRTIRWKVARVALTLMAFVMPLPPLVLNQALPQDWGLSLLPGMFISPVYFDEYYFGNANTMILALALLSFYFAAKDPESKVDLRLLKVSPIILSALFLALDTFKPTSLVLILPFWLILSRRTLVRSVPFFVGLVAVLNAIVLFEPVLLSGYWSKLMVEASISTDASPLWQVYEYVWYYTIPMAGALTVLSKSDGKTFRGLLSRLSQQQSTP